jgi:hypothetical protein
MWTFFGLLVGLIYGSFIAIKKYRLDFKLLVYPVVILLAMLCFILLASYIKNDRFYGEVGTSTAGRENRTGKINSNELLSSNELLNKGITAADNEEYNRAEQYFGQAASKGKRSSRFDSLAFVYSRIAKEKCRLYRRDSKLKYIPNHYYKYAALLTRKATPEVCE